MRICPECGTENSDNSKFCRNCGSSFENLATDDLGVGQNKRNVGNASNQKNKWIALILNFIGGMIAYCFSGIGHILYLRLYKRGLILCAIGLLITAIFGIIAIFNDSFTVTLLSLIFGFGLIIYSMYDAYKCTDAINEGKQLPLLFNAIDSESMSKSKVIAVILICVVALFALVGAIILSPEPDYSPQLTNGLSGDIIGGDVEDYDVQIKIICPVEWSASIGDENTSTHYEGTGNRTINIDSDDYEVIAAAVQKTKSGSDNLKVQIIKDGKVVDTESTTKDYGVVTVSATLDGKTFANPSSDKIQFKITCPVEWSASIGGDDTNTHYEGTGNKIIEVDPKNYKVIAAAVQKTKSGSDNLKVEIIKDGKVVDTESTSKDYGVVTVSTTI
ncbi:zinc ribbon domain-containing protein [uncultured Methanobrevibacter sp.]|uniref:zinc ribbon domain-containing protein n=1 Tax=uncultured Methanobrevibacter sp. TaxID=253161 RepID=UPI0025EE4753|nr:zinc-ribbon domain-containing protein [uncultured Methanobrevibacter sp.]